MLLSGRPVNVSGTCVACAMEGSRPLLAEVQGLVSPTGFGNPRRMTTGFDYNRLSLLLAVDVYKRQVVKRDKSREAFDREKLLNGMLRACQKRPVSIETLEKVIDDIEAQIQNSLDREVTSRRIGEYAMEKLKEIDEVAYVRFASVYREFKDINSFHEEISRLMSGNKDE